MEGQTVFEAMAYGAPWLGLALGIKAACAWRRWRLRRALGRGRWEVWR